MAKQLFPTFEIPTITRETKATRDSYYWPGPLFDFEKGDFVLNGANQVVMVDGNDAFSLWCVKCVNTQLGACLAYPDFGVDIEGAMAQPTIDAATAELERGITEALMKNPRTERVYGFEFSRGPDELYVKFVVKPYSLEAFDILMNVVA